MQCLRTYQNGEDIRSQIEKTQPPSSLRHNEVLIRSKYSGINYKDALAVTGRGRILKQFPLTPGIDVSGTIEKSNSPTLQVGQSVLVTGCGMGETYNGGFAEFVVAQGENVIPLPKGLTERQAMILGTAGFTAALCLKRMEQLGQSPKHGPIVITGASGGVGGFATQIFSQQGYEVHAVSSKSSAADYLKKLGAKKVLHASELKLGTRPLEAVRFGGAVDNVGGSLLSQILAHTELWGNVASVGLAASSELHTSVMPFILRGVSLLGVSSNNTPRPLREDLWQLLANQWLPNFFEETIFKEISLNEVIDACHDLINNRVQGRYLVKIS